MIINTGMRTDIPAFYAEWFANRIRDGYVCTRNSYNPTQVTKYSLNPDVVDIIAFCTKNPRPMLAYMDILKPYAQYWFVTITPYGRDIEPNVPPKEEVMQDFITLSDYLGADSMGWRYDPILLSDTYTIERHISDFECMAKTLAGHTHSCVISFIDLYQKVRRNFPEAREVSRADKLTLGKEFARIAGKYDMVLRPCAEGSELAQYGADCSGCMTQAIYEQALGARLNVPANKSQRKECACLLGRDIGQYDTCGHLCKYCYANSDKDAVRANMGYNERSDCRACTSRHCANKRTEPTGDVRLHDPKSPLLVGRLLDTDVVHEAKQESWVDRQMRLEDLFSNSI